MHGCVGTVILGVAGGAMIFVRRTVVAFIRMVRGGAWVVARRTVCTVILAFGSCASTGGVWTVVWCATRVVLRCGCFTVIR